MRVNEPGSDLGPVGQGSPSVLSALWITLFFCLLFPLVSSIYVKVSCRLVLYYQCDTTQAFSNSRVAALFEELSSGAGVPSDSTVLFCSSTWGT